MGKITDTQKFYAIAVNPEGTFPLQNKNKIKRGLFISCLIELALGDYISYDKNLSSITIKNKYPRANNYLSYVYDFLYDRQGVSADKTLSTFFTKGKYYSAFLFALNRSLYEKGYGFKVNNELYIVQKEARKQIIVEVRRNYFVRTDLDDDELPFVTLVYKCDLLKECFDEFEIDIIKGSFERMSERPCKRSFEVINNIDFSKEISAKNIIDVLECFCK